jgi:hypothetical protein
MPKTPLGFPVGADAVQLSTPWEAWRLGWMMSELWMTSAYTIMSRTNWLAGADPTRGAPLREWQRMWNEKMSAGLEVAIEVQRAGTDLVLGRFDAVESSRRMLRPLHRRTVSNSRRLAWRDRSADSG